MDSDKEILDRIQKHVDMAVKAFYNHGNDQDKTSVSSFALGLVAGELMRREKDDNTPF